MKSIINSNFDNYQPKGNYASANHNHSGVYQPAGSYAPASHNHDGRYYYGSSTWLTNGSRLTDLTPGTYQCSPNNKPNVGFPSWCSEYGQLSVCARDGYTHIMYIDVFGKFGLWASNSQTWDSYAKEAQFITGGAARNDSGLYVTNGSNSAYTQVTASAFNQNSSKLIKDNISEITDDEAKNILNITPIHFDYINEFGGIKDNIGFIAEEVLDYIPQVINIPENYSENDFDKSKGLNNKILSLDYSKLTVHIVKMIQMQEKRINELENQLKQIIHYSN